MKPEQLGLTVRQADVLKLLVEGKPNKLICRDLRLSEGTVKVHVSAILRALNVRNRTQVDAKLIAGASRLRVIGRLGVGLDNIDVAACVGSAAP